ncbi:IPT/TIG domain-containing protein [Cytophagaceae bacterium YF14B1]|uniref:IPT/TIG domain-containing protein n=1 Tax=Xanthocytophaga flava TaxID=3048013 RepID=A0AAE3QKI8_9BACT|nr:IPT/TIG domain-containing protein [Xanthocytophaga flavus]MDJ1479113.1 IPT/TIG domain-containing protein [Xanthocytophaga flavus]
MKALFSSIVLLLCLLINNSCKTNELGPGNYTGQEITPEQRMTLLAECTAKYTSLQNEDTAQARQQLIAWLKTRPEFIASGYDDESQNAWAIFTDGRFVMFVDNRPQAPFEDRSGRVTFESKQTTVPANSARETELPDTKKVLLFSGMGSAFIDTPPELERIFAIAKTGYQIKKERASIDNLKGVGAETAVFYLSTHGGRIKPKDKLSIDGEDFPDALIGFWTTDSCTVANEAKYKDDLDKKRLGYMVAKYNEPTRGNPIKEAHYVITQDFVNTYMSFGKNALIYLDACNSYMLDEGGDVWAGAFINKAQEKKATYIGWSKRVLDKDAYQSAKFLFDRLLGADYTSNNPNLGIPKETPSQRPFDIDAVMTNMIQKGFAISTVEGETAVLHHASTVGPDTHVSLKPSIAYMEIDELASKLTIYGIFGTDPGDAKREVTVNETKVTVNEWKPDKITCTIPVSGNGAAGEVIVKAYDQKSNSVPLTEWYIPFTWSETGKFYSRTVDVVLHLRADVHRYRTAPGETPKPIESPDVIPSHPFAKDSKATYKAGGSCSYTCPCNPGQFGVSNKVIGSPEINIPYSVDASNATNKFFAIYGWDKDRKVLTVFASGSNFDGYKNQEVSGGCTEGGTTTENTPLPLAFVISESLNEITLELPFANTEAFDFRIKKGERSMETIALEHCACQDKSEAPIKLSWKDTEARFAPTAKTAARLVSAN